MVGLSECFLKWMKLTNFVVDGLGIVGASLKILRYAWTVIFWYVCSKRICHVSFLYSWNFYHSFALNLLSHSIFGTGRMQNLEMH